MKKRMIDIAIVLTILLAMSGSAYAGWDHGHHHDYGPIAAPDGCLTSVLLAGAAGGLGLLRRFLR
jgi:hypothetical protein